MKKTNYFLKNQYLSKNRSFLYSLNIFFGINKNRGFYFFGLLGYNKFLKNKHLNKFFFEVIKLLILQIYPVEDQLSFFKKRQLEDYLSIRNYKGVRFTLGLPVRGQRTSTNASTSRKFILKK